MKNERKEIIKISESLSGILQKMNPQQQEMVQGMFEHYMLQYRELRETNDAKSLAKGFHDLVQQAMDEEVAKQTEYEVTCGKGCSFCCYLQVDVSDDEAELLTEFAKEKNIDIDYSHLEKQLVDDADKHNKLPFQDRKCVFLDNFASCKVYEHRPSSCRKYLSVSEPSACDTDKNLGAEVGKLVNVEAEVITSSMLNARKSGSMAEMLILKK